MKKNKRRSPDPFKRMANQLIKAYGVLSIPYPVLARQSAKTICLINDELWRRYIIRRDGKVCRLSGLDTIRCSTVIQSAHIITRGNYRLRCEPRNGMALCTAHHKFYTHSEYKFHDLIRRRFPEVWQRLEVMSGYYTVGRSVSAEFVYIYLKTEYNHLITADADPAQPSTNKNTEDSNAKEKEKRTGDAEADAANAHR